MHTPEIVYEDNHLLILNKPAGWLVQGDRTGDRTLSDWGRDYIRQKYQKPGNVFLHPVNRIDRPVSGLVVFGRTSKGTERMNKLFSNRSVTKIYLAIVRNRPEQSEGTLVNWLVKDMKKNRTTAFDREKKNSKKAILSYKLVATHQAMALLKVEPQTGRPHQIRVQLAKMGHPILGDLKYGATAPLSDKDISLHAFQLKFEHPVRKEVMTLRCPPSTDDWQSFRKIINELD